MAKKDFPAVPKALLDHLNKTHPSRVPTNPEMTLEEFKYLQGQRSVIELLQTNYDAQNTTVLEKQ